MGGGIKTPDVSGKTRPKTINLLRNLYTHHVMCHEQHKSFPAPCARHRNENHLMKKEKVINKQKKRAKNAHNLSLLLLFDDAEICRAEEGGKKVSSGVNKIT